MKTYDELFNLGFDSFKVGMPYFCTVPENLYEISSANSTPCECEGNLVLAYCNGYTAGYYSKACTQEVARP